MNILTYSKLNVAKQPINHRWTIIDPQALLYTDHSVQVFDSPYGSHQELLKEFAFNFTGQLLPDTGEQFVEYQLSVSLSLKGDNQIRSFAFKTQDKIWASVDIDSAVNLLPNSTTDFNFSFVIRILKPTFNISTRPSSVYLKSDANLATADLDCLLGMELVDLGNTQGGYANLTDYSTIGLDYPNAQHLKNLPRQTGLSYQKTVVNNGVSLKLNTLKNLDDIKVIYLPIICSLGLMVLVKKVTVLTTGINKDTLSLANLRSLTIGFRINIAEVNSESY